jgi:AP-4 complex subunit epsilon-1
LVLPDFLKLELTQMISQAKGKTLSREFFELIKNIGEARSKQEEDFLMRSECKKLSDELHTPDPRKMKVLLSLFFEKKKKFISLNKEYMLRLIYCEMFGFKSEFGYIHAINLTQNNQDLVAKRVGYLAVCTFLHPSHELLILAINSVQKDLQKDNVLEVCAALTTICKLMSLELIPAG